MEELTTIEDFSAVMIRLLDSACTTFVIKKSDNGKFALHEALTNTPFQSYNENLEMEYKYDISDNLISKLLEAEAIIPNYSRISIRYTIKINFLLMWFDAAKITKQAV